AQVTDIYKFDDMYAVNIDFRRQEYCISYVTVTFILYSPKVDELWAKLEVLYYSTDSYIRLLDKGPPSEEE
ncbi:hypothetical protein V8F33_013298, partial [Rhypophila sp. PSN 637]